VRKIVEDKGSIRLSEEKGGIRSRGSAIGTLDGFPGVNKYLREDESHEVIMEHWIQKGTWQRSM
jgi:hypothetical protein